MKPFRLRLLNKPTRGREARNRGDTDEEGYVYAVSGDMKPMYRATIDGRAEPMFDSGAAVNLINEITYKVIYRQNKQDAKSTRMDCQAFYHCSQRSKLK